MPVLGFYDELTSRLRVSGDYLWPLALRLILAWEFWESGLTKLNGENWFAEIPWADWQKGFPFPAVGAPPLSSMHRHRRGSRAFARSARGSRSVRSRTSGGASSSDGLRCLRSNGLSRAGGRHRVSRPHGPDSVDVDGQPTARRRHRVVRAVGRPLAVFQLCLVHDGAAAHRALSSPTGRRFVNATPQWQAGHR